MEEKEERNASNNKYNDLGNQDYNYDYGDNGGEDEYFDNDGNDDDYY